MTTILKTASGLLSGAARLKYINNNRAFWDKSNTLGSGVGLYDMKRHTYCGAANLAP